MLSLFKSNQSVSACLPNNLGNWQDQIIVDCHRMMMSKITMASIGKWRVGQTQHVADKSIWNFVHSERVMLGGIHFEHMI